jgi:hypothetical protein
MRTIYAIDWIPDTHSLRAVIHPPPHEAFVLASVQIKGLDERLPKRHGTSGDILVFMEKVHMDMPGIVGNWILRVRWFL